MRAVQPVRDRDRPGSEPKAHVHLNEGGLNRLAALRAHRECLPGPVQRRAKPFDLVVDDVAGRLLPLPDLFEERLAAEVVPTLVAVALDLLLDDGLGGDASVVAAGNPERPLPGHSVPPNDRVFDRIGERVAKMKRARYVRRRDYDHKTGA